MEVTIPFDLPERILLQIHHLGEEIDTMVVPMMALEISAPLILVPFPEIPLAQPVEEAIAPVSIQEAKPRSSMIGMVGLSG